MNKIKEFLESEENRISGLISDNPTDDFERVVQVCCHFPAREAEEQKITFKNFLTILSILKKFEGRVIEEVEIDQGKSQSNPMGNLSSIIVRSKSVNDFKKEMLTQPTLDAQ